MDNSFQTSFIPKKPIIAGGKAVRPPTSILTVVSVGLLILVGVSSAGLYLYKNYLIKQEQVLSDSLSKVRDSFDSRTIDELALYDKRVAAAKSILDGHIVLSPLFATLGSLTIPSIQYISFSHDSDAKGFKVRLSGTALDYRSVALQADVFNTAKARFFRDVVFSNITKDKNNKVNFDLEFTVDHDLLSYEKNLQLDQIQAKIQSGAPVTPSVQAQTPSQDNNAQTQTNTPVTPATNNTPVKN